MKKDESDELRAEYRREQLGQGIRGKYLEAYGKGPNLVLLKPDVAKVFQSEEDINDALRSLVELAKKSSGADKGPRARCKVGDSERRGKKDKIAKGNTRQ